DERANNGPASAWKAALKPVTAAGKDFLETGSATATTAAAGTTATTRYLAPGTSIAGTAPSSRIVVPRHHEPFSGLRIAALYRGLTAADQRAAVRCLA